jgi:DNA polymerase III delta prime subunit
MFLDSMERKEFLWSQKYRPITLSECILPSATKKLFEGYIKQGELQNLILSGPPGMGKTTVAQAVLRDMGNTSYQINGSLEGIDTLRTEIAAFATSVSLDGGRKYVIIDEADNATHGIQMALRGFVEEFSSNCGFILTCNYSNKIITPLRESRFSLIDFSIPREDKADLQKQVMLRMMAILKREHIEFEPKVLGEIIKKKFPDLRSILNELQRMSTAYGKIDSAALTLIRSTNVTTLLPILKEKKFLDILKWTSENPDVDFTSLLDNLKIDLYPLIETASIPSVIMILNKYDYQNAFCTNKELNMTAMFTELMSEIKFKK